MRARPSFSFPSFRDTQQPWATKPSMVDASHDLPVNASSRVFDRAFGSRANRGACLLYWNNDPISIGAHPSSPTPARWWFTKHITFNTPRAFSARLCSGVYGGFATIRSPRLPGSSRKAATSPVMTSSPRPWTTASDAKSMRNNRSLWPLASDSRTNSRMCAMRDVPCLRPSNVKCP